MAIRHIPVHLLETFTMVVEHGTFHAAAEKMCLTQSAVSQQMKNLEEMLGFELFDRIGRGKFVNTRGRRVYDDAIKVLHANLVLVINASAIADELKIANSIAQCK